MKKLKAMTLTERTTAALAWIGAQLAICNAATDAPWTPDWGRIREANCKTICATVGAYDNSDWLNNAAFIAATRTGYPAMLEIAALAINGFGAFLNGLNPKIEREYALTKLDELLTKIEKLQ
jgi:hypothetical protein